MNHFGNSQEARTPPTVWSCSPTEALTVNGIKSARGRGDGASSTTWRTVLPSNDPYELSDWSARSDPLTCPSFIPPVALHRPQGGGVAGGRGLGEVGVAEISAAAAEAVAAVLDLRGCRRYQATVAMTLLLVADVSPTTWMKRHI